MTNRAILVLSATVLLVGCNSKEEQIAQRPVLKTEITAPSLSERDLPIGRWITNAGLCNQRLVLENMHEFEVTISSVSSFGVKQPGKWMLTEAFDIQADDVNSCITFDKNSLVFAKFNKAGTNYHVAYDQHNQVLIRKTRTGLDWFTPYDADALRNFTIDVILDVDYVEDDPDA